MGVPSRIDDGAFGSEHLSQEVISVRRQDASQRYLAQGEEVCRLFAGAQFHDG